MNRLIAYLISAIGMIGLFFSTEKAQALLPFSTGLPPKYFLLPSLAIVAVGIVFLLITNNPKSEKEVPIYKGNKIVGYRRH